MLLPAAPDVVPYLAPGKREKVIVPRLAVRRGPMGPFLGYVDETGYDRDSLGALWVRQAILPEARRGPRLLREVHALRQRRATLDMLCQVCGKPTLDGSSDRRLFLLRDAGHPILEGERTTSPPVCVPCALISVRACPHLRRGAVAAWVEYAPAWGVAGVLYGPDTLQPVPGEEMVEVPYGDRRIMWVLAARRVLELQDVTPVDLAELAS